MIAIVNLTLKIKLFKECKLEALPINYEKSTLHFTNNIATRVQGRD